MSAHASTVADMLDWESWPREKQEVARAALFAEVDAMRDDLEEDARQGLVTDVESVLRDLKTEYEAAAKALNEARDVTRPREERQKNYTEAQNALARLGEYLSGLENLL